MALNFKETNELQIMSVQVQSKKKSESIGDIWHIVNVI